MLHHYLCKHPERRVGGTGQKESNFTFSASLGRRANQERGRGKERKEDYVPNGLGQQSWQDLISLGAPCKFKLEISLTKASRSLGGGQGCGSGF